MKLYPKDATSTGERAIYIGVEFFAAGLFLFMWLSAFNVFHNFYSVACIKAGWGWKFPGVLITAIFLYNLYVGIKDEEREVSFLLILVLAILSLASFCGFGYPYIF